MRCRIVLVNVSRPYSVVTPTVDGDVLVALAGTTRPLTGRHVARLVRRGSVAAVAKALDRLVEQGLVLRMQAPPASLHTLNRQHVAAPAVEALAGIRSELLGRLRQALSAWDVQPLHACLFGSAARRDGDIDSDIDIFVVRPADVDDDDVVWGEQLGYLGDEVFAWTGNRASIVELAERDIARTFRDDPPVLQSLQRDGIDLAGIPLRKLLAKAV
jgi:Nucleotidyltransferase domain